MYAVFKSSPWILEFSSLILEASCDTLSLLNLETIKSLSLIWTTSIVLEISLHTSRSVGHYGQLQRFYVEI